MLNIGVLVSGGGTNLQAVIDAVERKYIPAKISAVVSSRKDAYALTRAKNYGIEAKWLSKKKYSGENEYEYAIIDYFEKHGVGLVLTAGFNIILNEVFVKKYENKMMNVHPSLIPSFCGKSYYGIKPHEDALKKGVKLSGATVHFVNEVTDGGPIILQKAVPVLEEDTPETLQKRIMEQAEQVIYPEAVKLFAEGKLLVKDGRVKILQ